MAHSGRAKTRLVQAIAEACGIDRREVVSPTFVLIQEHHGRRTIYHVDAYRLRDEDEFLALGPEEYFESDGLTLAGRAAEERTDAAYYPFRASDHFWGYLVPNPSLTPRELLAAWGESSVVESPCCRSRSHGSVG